MWPNPQFPLLKKSLMENFIFCAVRYNKEIIEKAIKEIENANPIISKCS